MSQSILIFTFLLLFSVISYNFIANYAFLGKNFARQESALYSGKGFGEKKDKASGYPKLEDSLKPSRSGSYRSMTGQFSSSVQKQCIVYETMKKEKASVPCEFIDLYARLKSTDAFWFMGKLGHYPNITHVEAGYSIAVMLKEYAKSLRPTELGMAVGTNIEIWHAPWNTEVEVIQNKMNLTRLDVATEQTVLRDYRTIGFEPEIYEKDQKGFCTRRNNQGQPLEEAFDVNFKAEDDPILKGKQVISTPIEKAL